MILLTLRTDKPEAELGLYKDSSQLAYIKWLAHLQLSRTIHKRIDKILNKSSISLDEVEGIVCYAGPGSFTGLRIGLSVANTLAYAQSIPIVAKNGPDWVEAGIKDLKAGKNDKIALPKYDRPAATTPPRK
jgi:tRNA threonylcarbamoyladenosine biosynthesis protein TsaB